jgi:hypothetical protein
MALDPDTHLLYLITATPDGEARRNRKFKEGSFQVMVVGPSDR